MKNKIFHSSMFFIILLGILFLPFSNFLIRNNSISQNTNINTNDTFNILDDDSVKTYSIDVNDTKTSMDIDVKTKNIDTTVNLTYSFTDRNSFKIDLINNDENNYDISLMISTPKSYDNDAMFDSLNFVSKSNEPKDSYEITNIRDNNLSIMFGINTKDTGEESVDYSLTRIDFNFSKKITKNHKGIFKMEKKDLYYENDKNKYSFFEKNSKILKKKDKDFSFSKGWSNDKQWNVGTALNLNDFNEGTYMFMESKFYVDFMSKDILTNTWEMLPIAVRKDMVGNWLTNNTIVYDDFYSSYWIQSTRFSIDISDGILDMEKINDFIKLLNDELGSSSSPEPFKLSSYGDKIQVLDNKEMFTLTYDFSNIVTKNVIDKLDNLYDNEQKFNELAHKLFVNEYTIHRSWKDDSFVFSNNGVFLYEDGKNIDIFLSNSQIMFFTLFSFMIVISMITVVYFLRTNKKLNENIIIKNNDEPVEPKKMEVKND